MKNIVITGGLGYIGMELCKLYSGNSRIDSITVIDNKFYSDRVSQIRRWNQLSTTGYIRFRKFRKNFK